MVGRLSIVSELSGWFADEKNYQMKRIRFFVNFGGKKIAYLWLKYLIVSTLISIIKVADVRIF